MTLIVGVLGIVVCLLALVVFRLCDRVYALEQGVVCSICEGEDAHFDQSCDKFIRENRQITMDAVMALTEFRNRTH